MDTEEKNITVPEGQEYVNVQERIMEEFSRMRETYMRMSDTLEDILKTALRQENIAISTMSIRIKKKEALRRKIQYKQKYETLWDVTDVLGCRIITLFEDDVSRVFAMLQREFEIVEVVDHRCKMQEVTEFGYNSLHVVVRFSAVRLQLTEYAPYADIKFEIQMRSALQHAWAEVEHGLGYKNEYEVPRVVHRNLARVSAALEILDEEFVNIRDEIARYNKEIDRLERVMDTDVNIHSLRRYLDRSETAQQIAQTLADEFTLPLVREMEVIVHQKIPEKLAFLGIKTIREFDDALVAQQEQMLLLARQWARLTQPKEINLYSVGMFLLGALATRRMGRGEQKNLIDILLRVGEEIKKQKMQEKKENLQEYRENDYDE